VSPRAARRPNVVTLGGGHGCAAALRAVRRYAAGVTAVVSVADDGGSSGRLRELLDVVALGDLRKCLVALAEPGSALGQAFEHRFDEGELAGHALGNLVLAGLIAATGDTTSGVAAAADLLRTAGRVLPATNEPVVLKAEAESGEVAGQVAVSQAGRVRRISLVPGDAAGTPEALAAIARCDQLVIGPGSLYTSVLAAAAVTDVARALRATRAQRVYVCNLRPQVPETEGYDVAAHVAALRRHGVDFDVVVCDTSGGMDLGQVDCAVLDADLAGRNGLVHEPSKLASVLSDLLA